jgi:hypothetical protein
MGKWCLIFPPQTGWKTLDRVVWGISLLFVSLVVSLFVTCLLVTAVPNSIIGSRSTGGGFGFGGLWIQYDIRSGGLLPERFRHIVIAQTFPENQAQGSTGVFTFTFAGRNPIQVRSAGQETVWVDPNGSVTNLGRVLRPADIELMQTHNHEVKPPISTPEEFLAILVRLRAGETASTEGRHSETISGFREIESHPAGDGNRETVFEAKQ